MNQFFQHVKNYFFPRVDEEVQSGIDRESIHSLHLLSFAVAVFELFTLAVYVCTRSVFDRDIWVSIGSASFCLVACLVIFLYTDRIHKGNPYTHLGITLFKLFFCIALTVWAIWVSGRHYNRDEQLLTFFAVELMVVCFIPIRPWISTLLMGSTYLGLYAVLYVVDGAAGINIFNYIVLTLISIAGMIVRYHSQIRLSEKTVELQRKNETLEYMSRHDGLTGLRNRIALDADVEGLVGQPVGAYMIDVDFFKELNDTFGHSVGDAVLKETGQQLRQLFPGGLCYRYGGDEFLIITTQGERKSGEIHRFYVPEVPGREIVLCIGSAEGTPADSAEMFALINKADAGLYEVKKKTHTPELGGRDRRRR